MRQGQLIGSCGLLLALLLSGCTKEKRDAVITGGNASSGPATLSSLQADIFHLSCATSGCHDSRANPASNLDLSSSAQSYANLVNRASSEASQLKLVIPGDPDHSYLINKLLGTHAAVGGNGVQMPQYAGPLDEGEVDRVIAWIAAGAQQN
jgi:hypothetical protein